MNRFLPLVLFTLLIIVFRFVGSAFPDEFPNFQPLSALFFCGALIAKDWRGWAIPLAAWLITYPIPAMISGNHSYLGLETLFTTAVAFAAVFFLGKYMSPKHLASILAGSVVAALTFHLITNGVAWIGSPIYAKNIEGLTQSVWTGPLGSPIPSWVFLRNMAAANLIFTSLFLSARFALPKFSSFSLVSATR